MRMARIVVVGGEIVSSRWSAAPLGEPENVPGGFVVDLEIGEGDGVPNQDTHYVNGGTLVAYTPAQADARGRFPPYPAEWSNASMSWVDKRTPADLASIERSKVDKEIQRVERVTLRAIRELLLSFPQATFGGTSAVVASLQALRAADDAIATQRARLPATPRGRSTQ